MKNPETLRTLQSAQSCPRTEPVAHTKDRVGNVLLTRYFLESLKNLDSYWTYRIRTYHVRLLVARTDTEAGTIMTEVGRMYDQFEKECVRLQRCLSTYYPDEHEMSRNVHKSIAVLMRQAKADLRLLAKDQATS